MTFEEKYKHIVQKNNSLVCVGLDSDYKRIPEFLRGRKNSVFEFNKAIIEATHDVVCCYKPNSAFYEGSGAGGVRQLKLTCDYLREKYPDIPLLIDAKRGDIGNTNEGYMNYVFEYLRADAVTMQPYLGGEALKPFLDQKDKGIFILCKTSNPGSGEFQDLQINGKPLYRHIARQVAQKWNTNGNCMLVVGATYPEDLKEVRKIVGEMIILVPGVGSQGGEVERTIKAGLNSQKSGLIISASRSIIFASKGKDFAQKAREETLKLREEINKYR